MIEYIPPPTVSAKSASNSGGNLNGIDVLTGIQILLVQDYDDQLKSLGNQIKGITRIKQAYRKDIENIQNLLLKKTHDKDDPKLYLTANEFNNTLNKNNEYLADPNTGELLDPRQDSTLSNTYGKKIPITNSDGEITGYKYEVKKSAVETKIEQLKSKLDSLNEQSELMSLGLQSLTNQRKIAFETISNIINKQHDSVSTIVRNMKG